MGKWTADRRLVLSVDGQRVLGPEEEQTGTLLAAPGQELSEAICRRYNLGPYAKMAAPPEDKMAAPPEDKLERRRRRRGPRAARQEQ